jgi:hypothetical protein
VDKKGQTRIEENHRNQEQMMGGSGTLYSCKAARGWLDWIGEFQPKSGTAPEPSLLVKKRSEGTGFSTLIDCTVDPSRPQREYFKRSTLSLIFSSFSALDSSSFWLRKIFN